MHKARFLSHEERLSMTEGHSPLLKKIREGKDLPPPAPGAVETNLQLLDDENHCPVCGAELRHVGGCVECPNRDWSKCG